MKKYQRVDDLVGDCVSLLAQLVEDRVKKLSRPIITYKGGLDEGGDDTFFDYCFNGLQTIQNMAALLRLCQNDEFLEGEKSSVVLKMMKKMAKEENMKEDFYFQDCIDRDAEASITKLYKMIGLKPLD